MKIRISRDAADHLGYQFQIRHNSTPEAVAHWHPEDGPRPRVQAASDHVAKKRYQAILRHYLRTDRIVRRDFKLVFGSRHNPRVDISHYVC